MKDAKTFAKELDQTEPLPEIMPAGGKEDQRNRVNTVTNAPTRHLVTYMLSHRDREIPDELRSEIIETEPSLWWRGNLWNDKQNNYRKCAITFVWKIDS